MEKKEYFRTNYVNLCNDPVEFRITVHIHMGNVWFVNVSGFGKTVDHALRIAHQILFNSFLESEDNYENVR